MRYLFGIILSIFIGNVAMAAETPRIIQPIPLAYSHYERHVMLYFLKHPVYEAMEAMISSRGEAEPAIRIILTRHDQSQIDYFNLPDQLARFRAEVPGRESHLAEIAYRASSNGGLPRVVIDFMTADREEVAFRFIATSAPNSDFGGLTDPEGHAGDSALPVMVRDNGCLADEASSVSFNGTAYEIPVHTHVPFFFKGMKGYYSDHFRIGVVAEGERRYGSVAMPETLSVGEGWSYDSKEYSISETDGAEWIIKASNEELVVVRNGAGLALHQVRRKGRGDDAMTLRFTPYLPYGDGAWPDSVRFSISVGSISDAVSGSVRRDARGFTLIPETPEWALSRVVHITIDGDGSSTRIGED